MGHFVDILTATASSRYENIPMVRGILEGIDPKEMLQNWGAMLPELMAKWGLERAEVSSSR